jgi:ribosomal protein S12 methylthiotransferase
MAIQSKTSRRLLRRRQTQVCKVLVEGIESDGIYYGRSYGEAPEVDGLVYISSDNPLKIGEFTDVRITRAFEYDLLGEAYESRK